ncbi:unnamed protein product [Rangifer tarandus platyrhynchus]|uniref:Uncharacterized protein n=1 Tax=Rangifer tarandus platyrhynchus TaxID=3082113 RepID=A0AC59YF97_RANTA
MRKALWAWGHSKPKQGAFHLLGYSFSLIGIASPTAVRVWRGWRAAHAYLATPSKSGVPHQQLPEERGSLQTLGSLPRLCQDRGGALILCKDGPGRAQLPEDPHVGARRPGEVTEPPLLPATTAGPALDWTR